MIKAILGLGNPGLKFYNTRHNIGFQVVDALAASYNSSFKARDKMEVASVSLNGQTLVLVKPLTFMNNSGEVVPYLQKQGIKAENTIVVHDELELPFGKAALKKGGSAKGHNGLRSLIAFSGPDFWRLRCGIGRPERKEDVPHYVLAPFTEGSQAVERLIADALALIEKEIPHLT